MILNILKQLVSIKRAPVLIKKIAYKLIDFRQHTEDAELLAWLEQNASDFEDFAKGLDPVLWSEAKTYAERARAEASKRLSKLPVKLGGGGYTELLYFLTRLIKPKTVVETGVAAGHSSRAILTALAHNRSLSDMGGRLYSSDFPYFRIQNPEQYIGVLVDESLTDNWSLYIDGDSTNLPKIAASCGPIDLFHYDSEKRYSGRGQALRLLQPVLTSASIVIMDDINDNSFFKDYVARTGGAFRVFRFAGKFVGLKGDLRTAAKRRGAGVVL